MEARVSLRMEVGQGLRQSAGSKVTSGARIVAFSSVP